jgi:predicted SnoaL-like aldol condensation-catalyzing enzyme
MTTTEAQNKAFVLESFDTLFNKRNYAAAERFWSPAYIQHSAHIAPRREGLFELVKAAPKELHYENALSSRTVTMSCSTAGFQGSGSQ